LGTAVSSSNKNVDIGIKQDNHTPIIQSTNIYIMLYYCIFVAMLSETEQKKDSAVKCLDVLSTSKPDHWKSILEAGKNPFLTLQSNLPMWSPVLKGLLVSCHRKFHMILTS
jgi:hypothetical protein